MIHNTPDNWDNPLGHWFDNMLNVPRKVKKIEVTYSNTPHIIVVNGPHGQLTMSKQHYSSVEPLGLSLRRPK